MNIRVYFKVGLNFSWLELKLIINLLKKKGHCNTWNGYNIRVYFKVGLNFNLELNLKFNLEVKWGSISMLRVPFRVKFERGRLFVFVWKGIYEDKRLFVYISSHIKYISIAISLCLSLWWWIISSRGVSTAHNSVFRHLNG